MAEPFTIYKLTILYMLSKVDFPLTNTQLTNFFLEQEYTDYFRVQEVIGDLAEAELLHAESTHSNTQYTLTSAGKETLEFFKDKLNEEIEADVLHFFERNKLEFKQENSILADYYKTTHQKYAVRCRVRSDGRTLIDLTLTVSTREQAEAICSNWKNQNEDVYAYLMDMLVK
jgi:predicted transcriptional regulator